MPNPFPWERSRAPAFQAYMPPGAAALHDLGPGACRWPVGEIESEDFAFCGTACGHRSYCPAHRRLALRRRR